MQFVHCTIFELHLDITIQYLGAIVLHLAITFADTGASIKPLGHNVIYLSVNASSYLVISIRKKQ